MFTRPVVQRVRLLLAKHLNDAEFMEEVRRLGVDFSVAIGNATYARDGSNVTYKVTLAVKDAKTGVVLNVDAQCFQRQATSYGMKPEWLNQSFTFRSERYTIVGLRPRSHKYPVLARKGERTFKFQVQDVITAMRGPTTPLDTINQLLNKRPDTEIIADLRRVELSLEPENLTCDGELPKSQWLPKQRRLQDERQRLVRELGREPTTTELWGA